MQNQQFYDHVEKFPTLFFAFAGIITLFFSGISFTFVIPGLKGFDLFFLILTLAMFFIVSAVFVSLYHHRKWKVFAISLLLSSIGMGLRIWLEWGEFSLVEHMNVAVYIGYPTIIALIITLFYSMLSSLKESKLSI